MEIVLREINDYTILSQAVHPTLGIIKVGDMVVLNDDHIIYGSGKDYIETIKMMFKTKESSQVYITKTEHKDSEFKRQHWASRPMGNYLVEVKKVISAKEFKAIQKAKQLLQNYI